MNEIDELAELFRATLIPTVAAKIPWAKTTPESRQSYIEATGASVRFALAAVIAVAKVEVDHALLKENAALRQFIEQQGIAVKTLEDGTIAFESRSPITA